MGRRPDTSRKQKQETETETEMEKRVRIRNQEMREMKCPFLIPVSVSEITR
jgi:hypothetical protein